MVSACLSQRLSRLDLLQTFPVTFPHEVSDHLKGKFAEMPPEKISETT
jgi:hypothetical protein